MQEEEQCTLFRASWSYFWLPAYCSAVHVSSSCCAASLRRHSIAPAATAGVMPWHASIAAAMEATCSCVLQLLDAVMDGVVQWHHCSMQATHHGGEQHAYDLDHKWSDHR